MLLGFVQRELAAAAPGQALVFPLYQFCSRSTMTAISKREQPVLTFQLQCGSEGIQRANARDCSHVSALCANMMPYVRTLGQRSQEDNSHVLWPGGVI